MTIRAMIANRVAAAGIMGLMVGCATAEESGSSTQHVTSSGDAGLTAAYNVSDFNNLWTIEGSIGYFENVATIVLVNSSQPGKPLVRTNADGGSTGVAPFSAYAFFGGLEDVASLPSLGDCIAVKSASGGRNFTDEELRQKPEFGAFVYISDPQSGAPKRPAWGVGENGQPKVYKTVQQCLSDPDRSWSNANPNDKLTSVANMADVGSQLQLLGFVGAFEGVSKIALVNVGQFAEPIVLEKEFQARGAGTFDLAVDVPKSVKPGDCVAVKNAGGGRGFSVDEKRAKDEFGAFLYASTGANTYKVFRTSAECLSDSTANRPR